MTGGGWLSSLWPGRVAAEPVALGGSDAAAVAGLHAEGGFARGWSTEECAALLADPAILADGLRERPSGRLAGFVMSRRAADEAEILSIVVTRARRGAGLAARLLATHRETLARRGVAALFLEVEAENRAALALYRRAGFCEVGRREAYYPKSDGSRVAALVMRLDVG